MIGRIVEFSTEGTRLSTRYKQIVITRPNQPDTTLPAEDLGVVILDDRRATFSQSVFTCLMDAGAAVILTGENHMPVGIMLPAQGHHVQAERHIAQVSAKQPTRKRLWQRMVRAKIAQQAAVLMHYTSQDAGLGEMARRVRSGDPENLEAQAAQRYWPRLFGNDFRRDRTADGANALLNYGYAVFRAAIARNLAGAGLIPALGVHHHNRSNSFCLADDLLEPFRPYVDWRVRNMVDSDPLPNLSCRETRAGLLSLFNETVVIGTRRMPLLMAVRTAAQGLALCFVNGNADLDLPTGLPVEPDETVQERG